MTASDPKRTIARTQQNNEKQLSGITDRA
jgi:hypothetical protein